MPTKFEAVNIGSTTLIGTSGEYPRERGNCFSVSDADGKDYRIVNFVYENLKHLITKGLTFPLQCEVLDKNIAVVNDHRIGDRWYQTRFCTVCCPDNLLTVPQQMQHRRHEALGSRKSNGGYVMITPKQTQFK